MADFLHTFFFLLSIVGLFWLVSQGFTYNVTNRAFTMANFPLLKDGVPNLNGVLVHGVVLAIGVLLLSALLMSPKEGFKLPEKEDEKNKN